MKKLDLLKKTRDLAEKIAKMEEVIAFKQVEQQINGNQKVEQFLTTMKSLQKQVTHLEHFQKPLALKEALAELEQVESALNALPIVQMFQQSQVEVNELLQMVTTVISDSVRKQMDIFEEGTLRSRKAISSSD